jgi:2-dehydro-3-deoxyglucarate aldolase/4-hydroxy-2-oxoheptanedioate aldolase
VDGVDVLFVGPSDLSHALGMQCAPDDPGLLARVAAVARAARDHAKCAGVLVGTLEQARAYRELGFTFIGCASDGGLLATHATAVAQDLRGLERSQAPSVEGAPS